MPSLKSLIPLVAVALSAFSSAQKIVLTNDDGWATAQIRAEYNTLTANGYDVILSAPAENSSGSGSLSRTPTTLNKPCEFDSCPAGSPPYGSNATNPRLNYVNGYPVDAAKYGIQTLSPQLFTGGSKPDLVVSGPNIGANTGLAVFFSGTVGAACESAKEGIPAIAFSGSDDTTTQESYTALTSTPTSSTVLGALSYASLTTTFLKALFQQPSASPALLPSNVIVNVNFPELSSTCQPQNIQWVFTRAQWTLFKTDLDICDYGGKLPTEGDVVGAGCYASVTVLDANTKFDVGKDTQTDVYQRLAGLGFTCFSK